jgi:hypothetical protein
MNPFKDSFAYNWGPNLTFWEKLRLIIRLPLLPFQLEKLKKRMGDLHK